MPSCGTSVASSMSLRSIQHRLPNRSRFGWCIWRLAGWKPWKWGLLGILLAGVSIKGAWMQWLICAVVSISHLRPITRWLIYGGMVVMILIGLSVGHALFVTRLPDANQLSQSLHIGEGAECDPFLALRDCWIGTAAFALLALVCLRVRLPNAVAARYMRLISFMTLAICVASAIYFNLAPEIHATSTIVRFRRHKVHLVVPEPGIPGDRKLGTWVAGQNRQCRNGCRYCNS